MHSKKSYQNYGKIKVRTNDTNISFQIDFNVDLTIGSLEFFKDQIKFHVAVESIEAVCQSKSSNIQKEESKL